MPQDNLQNSEERGPLGKYKPFISWRTWKSLISPRNGLQLGLNWTSYSWIQSNGN